MKPETLQRALAAVREKITEADHEASDCSQSATGGGGRKPHFYAASSGVRDRGARRRPSPA